MFLYSWHSLLYRNLGEKILYELSEIFQLIVLGTFWVYT